jgi:NAD(P)-dependent dehydrogenase (short-subunit alcohol dehydrogenase family)
VPLPQNVTDKESILQSVAITAEHTEGSLDILINNAGISPPDKLIKLEELDLWSGWPERTIAVNALAPMRVTQAFLPLLALGSLKKIAMITSEAGSIGENWRNYGYSYGMSKAACNMFSQILQRALKPRGFKVLLFHPGWMRTDMGGAQAHIAAETAAEGIYKLTMRDWSLDDPMYMDYTGKLFRW